MRQYTWTMTLLALIGCSSPTEWSNKDAQQAIDALVGVWSEWETGSIPTTSRLTIYRNGWAVHERYFTFAKPDDFEPDVFQWVVTGKNRMTVTGHKPRGFFSPNVHRYELKFRDGLRDILTFTFKMSSDTIIERQFRRDSSTTPTESYQD